MISIEEIKENYKGFSDSKIENIAQNESKKLRKEVLEILKEEIARRDLDEQLIVWVDAENHTLSDLEKQSLIKKIENLKCPSCGKKESNLIGQEFNIIVSAIRLLSNSSENRILCANCGRKKKIRTFLINGLLGWWSVPGIFLTPYTLLKDTNNIFSKKKIHDRIIAEFIERNNGMFRIHGMDDETLFGLILWHNKDYEIPEIDEETTPDNTSL
jgi:hypothetical protein